jgi:hypothetical protein
MSRLVEAYLVFTVAKDDLNKTRIPPIVTVDHRPRITRYGDAVEDGPERATCKMRGLDQSVNIDRAELVNCIGRVRCYAALVTDGIEPCLGLGALEKLDGEYGRRGV